MRYIITPADDPLREREMDYSSKTQRQRSALDQRSVIVAVVVLLVGAALGFGGGYKYAKHGTTTKAKSGTTATGGQAQPSHSTPSTASAQSQAETHAKLVACLATKGVKYSSPQANLSKPPPGVSESVWNNALGACYASGLKAG